MDRRDQVRSPRLHLLSNSLYEYDRGVRQLFLLTAMVEDVPPIRRRLEQEQVDYFEQPVNPSKTNVFFGKAALVETARQIASKPLNQLSPEEDFILGTLLSYDKERQCLRFLAMRGARREASHPAAGAITEARPVAYCSTGAQSATDRPDWPR